jgi:uncharacterized protein DUF1629
MTTADYAIFRLTHEPGYALIDDDPPDMLRPMDLRYGLSVKKSFPKKAVCELSSRHKGKKLSDFFSNIMGALIVNEKAKAVLEAENSLKWEWYPLQIVDLKEKPFTSQYTWAHLLRNYECVDRKKSVYRASAIEPTEVHTFHKLVLDLDRVPKEPSLFRLKEQPGTLIIRSDLVDKLQAAKASGWETWKLNAPIML